MARAQALAHSLSGKLGGDGGAALSQLTAGLHCSRLPSGQPPSREGALRSQGTLTLAGVALADEAHHQGGAVAALRGAGEGLDAELVRFGLWEEHQEGERALCEEGSRIHKQPGYHLGRQRRAVSL